MSEFIYVIYKKYVTYTFIYDTDYYEFRLEESEVELKRIISEDKYKEVSR